MNTLNEFIQIIEYCTSNHFDIFDVDTLDNNQKNVRKYPFLSNTEIEHLMIEHPTLFSYNQFAALTPTRKRTYFENTMNANYTLFTDQEKSQIKEAFSDVVLFQ